MNIISFDFLAVIFKACLPTFLYQHSFTGVIFAHDGFYRAPVLIAIVGRRGLFEIFTPRIGES